MTCAFQRQLEDFLSKHKQVQFLRLQWIDYSGVLRLRTITIEWARRLASGADDYSVFQECLIKQLSGPAVSTARCFEDWKLRPDWESLVVCGFRPNHAAVMCFAVNLSHEDPFALCSRALLRNVLDKFHGLYEKQSVLMGFEIEFSLHDESNSLVRPIDRIMGHSMSAGLRGQNLDIMEEVIAALGVSGIEVHHFHVEGFDQLEISLAPLSPMRAIDATIMAQETLRTVFLRHGLRVSLTPKPALRGPNHGLHAHLSFNPGIPTSSSFLAGILDNLRTLCAFGMPSYDSYGRMARYCVGEWVGYGTGNRDLPIRAINNNRWEFRCLDATANPYLFFAATIAVGLDAARSCRPLTHKDCPLVISNLATEETESTLREHEITERLPKTLAESLKALRENQGMTALLGRDFVNNYLQVKDHHVQVFEAMSEEERKRTFLGCF